MMKEKFVIFFGFPGSQDQIENVEKFSEKTSQSLENAWIDFLHSFMMQYYPDGGDELFISTLFSKAYEMQVTPPNYEHSKYPEILGKTMFKLPALSFKQDFVTCKETGERYKVTDHHLKSLCALFQVFIEVTEVDYEWRG